MSENNNSEVLTENDDAVFRPASHPTDGNEIKVQRIRRDDRGHILSDEPVKMPRENLYYNTDGYIPQENINYGKKAEDWFFDEEDPEPEESEEFAVKPDEELFEEIQEETAEAGESFEPYGGEEDSEGEEPFESYGKEETSEAGFLEEEDENFDDGWAGSYIPPSPAEAELLKKKTGLPIPARIALAVCGVIAALTIGGFVALWDMGRTFGELRGAFSEAYVTELSEEYLNELRLAEAEKKEAEAKTVEIVSQEAAIPSEAGDTQEEDSGEEGLGEETEEEYENSNMEIAGLTSLVSAGSGDEIEIRAEAPVRDGQVGLVGYINPEKYYPLKFSTVGEEYFSDALFIGDSRLQGFGMYSGLAATYYCVTSFSVYKYDTMKVVQTEEGKVPIFDALPYDTFTKIYIKIGLNEMGGIEDLFYEKYAEVINLLRTYEPRAVIYIHAILPVTAAKSVSDKVHNNTNIYARNEKLRAFAEEQKAYFVEVSEDLLSEDGSLIPEATADGIHLKAKYMEPWKQQLMRQAVVIPQSEQ